MLKDIPGALYLQCRLIFSRGGMTNTLQVFRGYRARILFQERLDLHRGACKIQQCARRKAAKNELGRRAHRR